MERSNDNGFCYSNNNGNKSPTNNNNNNNTSDDNERDVPKWMDIFFRDAGLLQSKFSENK